MQTQVSMGKLINNQPEHPLLNETVYLSHKKWNKTRPHVLVVACSDGRLQGNVDDFLHNHLGIDSYDRLYMPGGPGALAHSGAEFLRADQWRREGKFLIDAHVLEEVILLFHAAAFDGPVESNCADYTRKLPTQAPSELRAQQELDTIDVLARVFASHPQLRIRVYRAEVLVNGDVQFVQLQIE